MKATNITYFLTPVDRGFAFRIDQQSSLLTDALKSKDFLASNGWRIAMEEGPAINISTKTIFLRGSNKDMDYRIDRSSDLASNRTRDKYVSEINSAIAELVDAVTFPVPQLSMSRGYYPTYTTTRSRKVVSNVGVAQLRKPDNYRSRCCYYDTNDDYVIVIY